MGRENQEKIDNFEEELREYDEQAQNGDRKSMEITKKIVEKPENKKMMENEIEMKLMSRYPKRNNS